MKLYSLCALLLGSVALTTVTSCAGPYVGPAPAIDAETLDVLTRNVTRELFEDIRNQDNSDEIWVAYVGVENLSSVPQGGTLVEIDAAVEEEFQNVTYTDGESLFRRISNRLVKAAQREAGIRSPEDLVLRTKREAFIKAITLDGHTPDYMMFGSITSVATGDGALRYRLTLEIMRYDGETIGQRSAKFTMR